MPKDSLEIFLEDISNKLDIVLKGQDSLLNEIREARVESNSKHDHTAFLIKTLNQKNDSVAPDLTAHRADTEAHHGIYMVKESEE